jgi:hypothetical protein
VIFEQTDGPVAGRHRRHGTKIARRPSGPAASRARSAAAHRPGERPREGETAALSPERDASATTGSQAGSSWIRHVTARTRPAAGRRRVERELAGEHKNHEREIETVLIRAASAMLFFNERKKRASIAPGSVTDYEPLTHYFERQYKKGKKAA